jgi:hypothetical protein
MARSPVMKRAVRRLADVLGLYSRKQGWWPVGFRLYFDVNEKWGRINILFVADGFTTQDSSAHYHAIMEYLRSKLTDESELMRAVGLVTRSFAEVAEGGLYRIGDNYQFVRPRDLIRMAVRQAAQLGLDFVHNAGLRQDEWSYFYRAPEREDRVEVVLALKQSSVIPTATDASFQEFLDKRLFDEPDLRAALDSRIVDYEEAESLKGAGYREYFRLTRI